MPPHRRQHQRRQALRAGRVHRGARGAMPLRPRREARRGTAVQRGGLGELGWWKRRSKGARSSSKDCVQVFQSPFIVGVLLL